MINRPPGVCVRAWRVCALARAPSRGGAAGGFLAGPPGPSVPLSADAAPPPPPRAEATGGARCPREGREGRESSRRGPWPLAVGLRGRSPSGSALAPQAVFGRTPGVSVGGDGPAPSRPGPVVVAWRGRVRSAVVRRPPPAAAASRRRTSGPPPPWRPEPRVRGPCPPPPPRLAVSGRAARAEAESCVRGRAPGMRAPAATRGTPRRRLPPRAFPRAAAAPRSVPAPEPAVGVCGLVDRGARRPSLRGGRGVRRWRRERERVRERVSGGSESLGRSGVEGGAG